MAQAAIRSGAHYKPTLSAADCLEFRVIGPRGQVIQSGKRKLTDLDYQLRTYHPMDDYLRYEKDLLRHWL